MTLNELIAKYNALATVAGLPTRKWFENKAKAEAAIAEVEAKTKATITEDKAETEVAITEVKAEEAIAEFTEKSKGAKLKIAKSMRTVKVHEKGPRGFRFGPVWMSSIKEGKGIALSPANMPKLLDTAAHFGVSVDNKASQADIVAAVAAVI
jgi:alpha-D-ribose 1-methylphosphonate 5-triphosphate synthase subunit PhnH